MGRIKDFLNAFNKSAVVLLVRSRTQPDKATEVSDDEPLPVRLVGSSPGGGEGGGGSDPDSAREATLQGVSSAVTATKDSAHLLATQAGVEGLHVRLPEVLGCAAETFTVGTVARGLPNTEGYNEATIHVVSGTVRRCVGAAASPQTPPLGAGDSEELRDSELIAYSLVSADGQDAQMCAEYRRLSHPGEQPDVVFD